MESLVSLELVRPAHGLLPLALSALASPVFVRQDKLFLGNLVFVRLASLVSCGLLRRVHQVSAPLLLSMV